MRTNAQTVTMIVIKMHLVITCVRVMNVPVTRGTTVMGNPARKIATKINVHLDISHVIQMLLAKINVKVHLENYFETKIIYLLSL